jgi:hypothetical protein
MAKMGRPPKDEDSKKTAHLSVRVSTSLRNRLEQARQEEGGRSLSEEVEIRLSSSFDLDKSIDELFGGKETRLIFQIVAKQIDLMAALVGGRTDVPYDPARPRLGPAKLHWTKDRFVHDQTKLLIDTVLQHFKPRGRPIIPKSLLSYSSTKREVARIGKHYAVEALALIEHLVRNRGNEADVPIYRQAARAVGRQLKGSPLKKYVKDQQRQIKEYVARGRDK